MASRKTSPPKPAKTAVKPRSAKAVVKDLRTGIEDLRAIDPEHPWARLLKEAVAAIREQQRVLDAAIAMIQEQQVVQLATFMKDSREGRVQLQGELEQIRTHLARFIDQGIRERGRDERIEAQLAGINERLKERSRDGRVVRHGKTTTAEELSRQLDAMERAKGEEVSTLRDEVKRLRSELEAARETAKTLEGMAFDPLDRRPMPPPRKSWRTTAAEGATAAPLD
jgi:chromosome segregation ATPase